MISLFFFFLSFLTLRSGILAYGVLQFVKAAAITGTYITLHPSVVLAG